MVGSRYFQNMDSAANQRSAEHGAMDVLEEICDDRTLPPEAADDRQFKERVEHVIEGEIIPRLMLLHRRAPSKTGERISDEPPDLAVYIPEFTEIVLRQNVDRIAAYLDFLLQKGSSLDSLLLHLMAPTARHLGELWEQDTIDFVDVTVGVSRLQQILHRLTFAMEKSRGDSAKRVLLVPTPSEQHTFGLLMVSDFFRRNGWDVEGALPLSLDEISAAVMDQWFALIGFSLSSEHLIDTLNSTIQTAREASMNRSVKIVVGGRVFTEVPELRSQVVADLIVSDAQEAVVLAENALGAASGKAN